jgi:hypothetical protein
VTNARSSMMRLIATIVWAVVVTFVAGCLFDASWPPPLPEGRSDGWNKRNAQQLTEQDLTANIGDWQYEKSVDGETLGWGPNLVDGKQVIPMNIFMVELVPDVQVDNFFVVEDYGSDYTLVALDKTKEHRLCLAYNGITAEGAQIQTTAMFPGTRAQVGENVYELRRDGWYLGEELMHSVTAVPPSR